MAVGQELKYKGGDEKSILGRQLGLLVHLIIGWEYMFRKICFRRPCQSLTVRPPHMVHGFSNEIVSFKNSWNIATTINLSYTYSLPIIWY